jgi:DegV family protein with EDD domain
MIQVIADTTSTISLEEAQALGLEYLPQMIIFGETSYRDDYEITTQEFLAKLRASSSLPKTAAPSPALYSPIYEAHFNKGNSMLVLCPSSKVSGTFRSASVAAQDFPGADIHIVDTGTIGPALGTLVRKALSWSNEGLSIAEIKHRILDLGKKVRIYFYVDTLEYLYKGGRIGAAKALMGSLLQVKPILLFKDGQVNPFESQRTKKKALIRLIELVKSECPRTQDSNLALLEADAMEDAIELREAFTQALSLDEIAIADLPPAIIVHAGPGVLAASFFLE